MNNNLKLTKRQRELIQKIREGYIILIGISDTTNQPYYMISKGYDNIYFKSDMFYRLLSKGLIYQSGSYPFDYVLTDKGEEIEL